MIGSVASLFTGVTIILVRGDPNISDAPLLLGVALGVYYVAPKLAEPSTRL